MGIIKFLLRGACMEWEYHTTLPTGQSDRFWPKPSPIGKASPDGNRKKLRYIPAQWFRSIWIPLQRFVFMKNLRNRYATILKVLQSMANLLYLVRGYRRPSQNLTAFLSRRRKTKVPKPVEFLAREIC